MATTSKKIHSEETPSEYFERIMQKVTKRQQRRQERLAEQLRKASANSK